MVPKGVAFVVGADAIGGSRADSDKVVTAHRWVRVCKAVPQRCGVGEDVRCADPLNVGRRLTAAPVQNQQSPIDENRWYTFMRAFGYQAIRREPLVYLTHCSSVSPVLAYSVDNRFLPA